MSLKKFYLIILKIGLKLKNYLIAENLANASFLLMPKSTIGYIKLFLLNKSSLSSA